MYGRGDSSFVLVYEMNLFAVLYMGGRPMRVIRWLVTAAFAVTCVGAVKIQFCFRADDPHFERRHFLVRQGYMSRLRIR
jgi:hypothetical protein